MKLQTLLYLQHADILPGQREAVTSWVKGALPDTHLVLADCPAAVPEGLVAEAVIAPTLPWLPEALSRLERYDWIHFLSSGVEAIWEMPFEPRSVILTRSAGVHGPAMSEFVLGAMLYFAKRFGHWTRASARPHWHREWLGELTGVRVTILGMGHVGHMVAERCALFGMRVYGLRRGSGDVGPWASPVSRDTLSETLAATGFLVVCLPLTPETRGKVGADLLDQLKPGAVLIDVSRSGVVVEAAVVDALNTGRLGGAALDVFEREPLPCDSRLWGRGDVLITPHVAGTTPFYLERALSVFLDNHRALCKGRSLVTPVDVEARY